MGFLSDITGGIFGEQTLGSVTGSTQEKAAREAARVQQEAAAEAAKAADFARVVGRRDIRQGERDALSAITGGREASLGFLEPLAGVGQQGIDLAGFLGDPSQQASFLESNPLFQLGLQNLNEQTQRVGAARGRLTAGDTLEKLQQNPLLVGQPLIDRQRQDILNLLGIGQNVAGQQVGITGGAAGNIANIETGTGANLANLERGTANQLVDLATGSGAAEAAGIVGGAQASAQGGQNILNLASLFSDPKLKSNKKVIGEKNGFKLWSWTWNDKGNKLGLFGSSSGVMADEVLSRMPSAISYDKGYMKVNYSMVGV